MKKSDFKKMALMGITGGVLLTSPNASVEADLADYGDSAGILIAHSGCGSGGGCRSSREPAQSGCASRNSSNHSGCASRSTMNQGNQTYGQNRGDRGYVAENEQNAPAASRMLTEEELVLQLNDEGKGIYQNLDSEGKALALKLANQSCKGKNDCKGMNACKTDSNSCAGKGGCKGTSPAPFQDKNVAVKVAFKKMQEKRLKSNGASFNDQSGTYNRY